MRAVYTHESCEHQKTCIKISHINSPIVKMGNILTAPTLRTASIPLKNLWAGPLRAEGAVAVIDFGDATTLAGPETPPTLGDDHLRLIQWSVFGSRVFGVDSDAAWFFSDWKGRYFRWLVESGVIHPGGLLEVESSGILNIS